MTARLAGILHAGYTDFPAPARVLELGCGDWESAATLRETFPASLIIGIDRHFPFPACSGFIQADIRALPFTARFDLVLIRHPDIDRSRSAWQPLIARIESITASTLIITTYSRAEQETLQRWIAPLPLSPARIDPSNIPLPDRVGRDRFYSVFRGVFRAGIRAADAGPSP